MPAAAWAAATCPSRLAQPIPLTLRLIASPAPLAYNTLHPSRPLSPQLELAHMLRVGQLSALWSVAHETNLTFNLVSRGQGQSLAAAGPQQSGQQQPRRASWQRCGFTPASSLHGGRRRLLAACRQQRQLDLDVAPFTPPTHHHHHHHAHQQNKYTHTTGDRCRLRLHAAGSDAVLLHAADPPGVPRRFQRVPPP